MIFVGYCWVFLVVWFWVFVHLFRFWFGFLLVFEVQRTDTRVLKL